MPMPMPIVFCESLLGEGFHRPKEIAFALDVSPKTVYKWVRQGRVGLNGRRYFLRARMATDGAIVVNRDDLTEFFGGLEEAA